MDGDVTGSIGQPDSEPVSEAFARYTNAHGGINGHPVDVIFCDNQGNPNVGDNCVRKGVSAHAMAIIDQLGIYVDLPVSDQAHIPTVEYCDCFTGESTDPGSFPLEGQVPYYVSLGSEMRAQGCTKPSILGIGGQPTSSETVAAIDAGLQRSASSVPSELVDPTLPSLNAPLATLVAKGTDCIALELNGNQLVAGVQGARQQAPGAKLFTIIGAASPQVLKQIGSGAAGMIVTGPVLTPSDTWAPAIRQFNEAVKKYDTSSVAISGYAPGYWATLEVATEAAKTVIAKGQALTGANEWKALNSLKDYNTGILAPETFGAKGSGVPTQGRVFNYGWTWWKIGSNGTAEIQHRGWLKTPLNEVANAAVAK